MCKRFFLGLVCFFLSWISAAAAQDSALPFVSPMFGNNMVLQRGKPNTIWGWSKPGDVIQVTIAGHNGKGVAGQDGRWEVKIMPPAPGGPYTVIIAGSQQQVELREVLVGDVWLCGGQSNMEFGLGHVQNATEEIKAAVHPEIRLFIVQHDVAYSPAKVPQGSWEICSPETIAADGWGGFSAVAYYFGRRLQEDIHVPVGLVEDCVGGTPAEAWTSAATLRTLKDFDAQLDAMERLKAKGGKAYGNYIMPWYDEYDIGEKNNWSAADLDDSGWKTVTLPRGFNELGVPVTPAVCWFRREISLPDPLPSGKATISLGVVERMDTTYINGQWVGASAWVENPRVYTVNEGVLKPGKNIIAIRLFKTKPDGGFMSPPKKLFIQLGGGTKIPLAGEWRGALSVDARPPHPLPLSFENWPVMPSVLYRGMIEPVAPLALTGAIWYQGEANADRPGQYQKLLTAMIGDWRKVFGQGDFPFYIVSLPRFMHHQDQPSPDGGWARIREAQAMVARTVKNSVLAVTIDTGEAGNIHPPVKNKVGNRLALCALGQHYREPVVYQGPTFRSVESLPGTLKIYFDHTDGGLVVQGSRLGEFSIAGKDHQWHWADAKIVGNSVLVSSPEVSEPQAVRYAWQSFPEATLYNGAGLPAVPFRTDDW